MYESLSRKDLVERVRNIRDLHYDKIKLNSSNKVLIDYLNKHIGNGNLYTIPIDIVGWIACLLDNRSFTRFVSAYPALARDVAEKPKYYQMVFSNTQTEHTTLCGRLHSFDNNPIMTGSPIMKHWYKHGRIHRDDNDLPAAEDLSSSSWYRDDVADRPNGLFTNRHKFTYMWRDKQNRPHRIDKPAYITYKPTLKNVIDTTDQLMLDIFEHLKANIKYFNIWYIFDDEVALFGIRVNGLQIIDDLSLMYLFFDMFVVTEKYYLNGKLHRTEGPAVISWGVDGVWYNDGMIVDSPKYLELSALIDSLTMDDVYKHALNMSRKEYLSVLSKVHHCTVRVHDISAII